MTKSNGVKRHPAKKVEKKEELPKDVTQAPDDSDVPEGFVEITAQGPIEHPEDKKKLPGWISMGIIIGTILIILFAIIIFIRMQGRYGPIENLHQKNLNDKFSDDNFIYEGFSFAHHNDLWYTRIMREGTMLDLPFRNSPKEVQFIPLRGDVNGFIMNMTPIVYITFDPEQEDLRYTALSAAEITISLRTFGGNSNASCTKNVTESCQSLPIVTCDNSESQTVIYLKEDSISMVSVDGNCLLISGNGEGMLQATDRFLYRLQGIY